MAGLGFSRRPLRSRSSGWAKALARSLARLGATPDAISAAGLAVSLIGAGCYPLAALHADLRTPLLLAAAACIQIRLVCNLVDGMVAVEHGRGGPLGPLWNEVPDRFSDAALLVAAGYGAEMMGLRWAEAFGWTAAILAVGTAYVRELGRGLGFPPDFGGVGAKPQRMAMLTVGTVGDVALSWPGLSPSGLILRSAVEAVAILTALTVVTRLIAIARALKARAGSPADA